MMEEKIQSKKLENNLTLNRPRKSGEVKIHVQKTIVKIVAGIVLVEKVWKLDKWIKKME